MRRPVVNKDIVDYMRTHLQENKGHLAELEAFARKENIPIIQHEVVAYFRFLLQTLQPKKILEVGTAIGFSALLMAEYAPDAQITTCLLYTSTIWSLTKLLTIPRPEA